MNRWLRRERLSDLYNSAAHSVVLVTNYAFDAGSIEALIDPIPVCEEFTHDHRFLAADASEGSGAPFVDEKP